MLSGTVARWFKFKSCPAVVEFVIGTSTAKGGCDLLSERYQKDGYDQHNHMWKFLLSINQHLFEATKFKPGETALPLPSPPGVPAVVRSPTAFVPPKGLPTKEEFTKFHFDISPEEEAELKHIQDRLESGDPIEFGEFSKQYQRERQKEKEMEGEADDGPTYMTKREQQILKDSERYKDLAADKQKAQSVLRRASHASAILAQEKAWALAQERRYEELKARNEQLKAEASSAPGGVEMQPAFQAAPAQECFHAIALSPIFQQTREDIDKLFKKDQLTKEDEVQLAKLFDDMVCQAGTLVYAGEPTGMHFETVVESVRKKVKYIWKSPHAGDAAARAVLAFKEVAAFLNNADSEVCCVPVAPVKSETRSVTPDYWPSSKPSTPSSTPSNEIISEGVEHASGLSTERYLDTAQGYLEKCLQQHEAEIDQLTSKSDHDRINFGKLFEGIIQRTQSSASSTPELRAAIESARDSVLAVFDSDGSVKEGSGKAEAVARANAALQAARDLTAALRSQSRDATMQSPVQVKSDAGSSAEVMRNAPSPIHSAEPIPAVPISALGPDKPCDATWI
jgi:hypothetical protein